MKETKLSRAFNWAGDSIEALGPSAYRFLASVLPYSTPIPVAWLTMKSAEGFLGFDPWVSFIFVFCLEGIGLWFTGLFVEAVIDFIRSKNRKTLVLVIMFGFVVIGYVYILVSLNVVLKTATGNANPQLAKVVTLLCFLPLMTGIGNGYYKVKLDSERRERDRLEKENNLEVMERTADLSLREKKLYLKHGIVPEGFGKVLEGSQTFQQVSNLSTKVSRNQGKVSEHLRNLVETYHEAGGDWRKLSQKLSNDQIYQLANLSPHDMKELSDCLGVSYKTVANWRSAAKVP